MNRIGDSEKLAGRALTARSWLVGDCRAIRVENDKGTSRCEIGSFVSKGFAVDSVKHRKQHIEMVISGDDNTNVSVEKTYLTKLGALTIRILVVDSL